MQCHFKQLCNKYLCEYKFVFENVSALENGGVGWGCMKKYEKNHRAKTSLHDNFTRNSEQYLDLISERNLTLYDKNEIPVPVIDTRGGYRILEGRWAR